MWFRMLRRVLLIILDKVKIKDMLEQHGTIQVFETNKKINENSVQAQGNFQLLHRLYCQQSSEGRGGHSTDLFIIK